MNRAARPALLLLTLAATTSAFAQEVVPVPPTPPQAPKAPQAPPTPAAAQRTVTLKRSGPLREMLGQIAAQGGINLIATGDLSRPAEVFLQNASAEEALETVATAYHLKVTRKGSIWTLRPMTDDEIEEADDKAESAHAEAAEATEDAAEAEEAEAPEIAEAPGDSAEEVLERLREKGIPVHKTQDGDEVFGGNLTIEEGQHVQSAVAYLGNLTVKGQVNGDAVAFGGNVTLGPEAVVKGDVVSIGGNIDKAPGARVKGEELVMGGGIRAVTSALGHNKIRIKHRVADVDSDDGEEVKASRSGMQLPTFFLYFAALFGVGFLFILFVPNRMKQIESELKADPLKCMLTGGVAAVAFLPLLVLLAITVIGIPVMLAMLLLAPLAILAGYGAIASTIGLRLPILRGKKTQAMVLALGLLVILLLGMIPVLGVILHSGLVLLSVGAVLRTRFGSRARGFPQPLTASAMPVG